MEDDHAAVFEMAEDLLNKFVQQPGSARSEQETQTVDNGLPYQIQFTPDTIGKLFHLRFGINGRACLLKTICEVAESRGLPYNGLLGKAFETVFL